MENAAPKNDTAAGLAALRESVVRMDPGADFAVIERCFEYAAHHHAGQVRRSGEPYVVHPLAVARTIADLHLDQAAVCAGLLHDTIEDTGATTDEIRDLFGAEVQMLVEGVTKLGQVPWSSREERQAENFRKMLLAMARDIRVVLIKLADRTDNMRTLGHMSREKQERIALETREIYGPLANRLGIQWMKSELEDLCFKYLEPQEYQQISDRLAATQDARAAYVAEVCRHIREAMEEEGIEAEVTGHTKHMWSLFKKTRKSGQEPDHVFDIVSFRIVTNSVRDCYATLGAVHTRWTPIPGRFKDYIALPKPNLYQSLHTTAIGPRSERIEVQIRTQEMDRTAQFGIAAHWRHKDSVQLKSTDSKAFAWLAQLMEWQRDLKDPTEFIETVKTDLFEEEVFVFTPNGDVKALPKGSTPIDFAYSVHTKVGDHCSGARINGIIVPLRYVLRNGDTVEILTADKQKPAKEWLKFVVTSRAKARVRHHLVVSQRDRSKQYGRDLLARELRSMDRDLATAEKEGRLESAARQLRAGTAEDLLLLIGYQKQPVDLVARVMFPGANAEIMAEDPEAAEPHTIAVARSRPPRRSVGGVNVQGEADVTVRFAKCCSPIPGDPITAFTTRGRSVMVHLRDCPKAMDLDPARRVDVSWDEAVTVHRPVSVEVVTSNRPGILANLSKVFQEQELNIAQAKCRTSDDKGINTFQVNLSHTQQLKNLSRALFAVEGVISVDRVAQAKA
ncbi:MAG: bifunctional (p)ppGpp synthetase/guanosine-3',5'-bis(diphosphate) 3'-pyrophosphohydrolase [Deltaproteobacteria bacterium]|nr:bifunctional (p)ppGpp synthetase/guanosine-3',5'-bis(diphosphate) 3'-pyrophosphohydrolase [Deltaproteobacteria bacterium]